MKTMKTTAFDKWLYHATGGDADLAIEHLIELTRYGSRAEIVWDLLKQTGDKSYSRTTFRRAAMACFERAKKNETAD